jgi:predicted metal-dependent hydrolase
MKIQNPFTHLDCAFSINESKRAKRIGLRIKAPNKVILTIPHRGNIKAALKFAAEHQEWVANKLAKAAKREDENQLTITPESEFSTKSHTFEFIPHQRDKAYIRIVAGKTRISHPSHWTIADEEMQNLVQLALKETYRKEAKTDLPERLEELAHHCGFKYNKVHIRDSKARWGSCSGQKNLSLSLWLMKLPSHLIDYILLHELCHTVHMNHGEHFHTLLDKVCDGRSKRLNKELKAYSIV